MGEAIQLGGWKIYWCSDIALVFHSYIARFSVCPDSGTMPLSVSISFSL